MAAGDTGALTTRGHSAAWALPLTLSGNSITAIGTAIKFKAISRHEGIFAAIASAGGGGAGAEVISIVIVDGVTIEVDRVTRKIEGTTGLNKNAAASGGGGGAAVDLVRWTTLLTGRTKIAEAAGMRGKPFLVCIPTPDAVDASEEGFYFLIGTMVSEVPSTAEAETIGSFPLEFQGGKSYINGLTDAAAFIAAATFGAITPASHTTEYATPAITPPALVEADLETLLKGELVLKAAA
jgi:hypothetical protein